jgi:poly(3-hydroxybutyrate) depolymerase
VLATLAGLVLVALAARSRGGIAARCAGTRRRRRARGVLAALLALLAFVFVVLPMAVAITETHKFREPIGAPPDASYREVAFDAGDGVRLSGWYRPTRNGATIIVLHGGGGDRTGCRRPRAAARPPRLRRAALRRPRARAQRGRPERWGWGWPKDVAGALAFLKARPEVDPGRIGGLGLSTGADVLVQVAGQRTDLAAVVADGTAASSFRTRTPSSACRPRRRSTAVDFLTVGVTSGRRPARRSRTW